MKISIDWLKSILPTEASADEISDLLSVSGLEVEHIEPWFSVGNGLKGFVVGEVMSCVPHPNADRLRVTTVNVGGDALLPIVCGAPNVAEGQKVLVALVGTEIQMPGKESFVIGKAKIRGEISEGMICAEDECGAGNSHDGILVLRSDAQVGMPASDYFGVATDVVLEIGLTANRGDAASHLGVANDLAALLKQDFARITHQTLPIKPQGRSVNIADSELCQRYIALEIQGLQLSESPDFVKHRLRAIGIEPRNNVVDTTNYFLHQTGQPMHAFDADLLEGDIVVRLALPDEKLVLLDGKSINVDPQDVVIADTSGPIALAGVMGGLKTAVNANTKNVLLEIAHFHPTLARKSAKRHHLHTDAGFRFERGVDVENMANAASLAGFHLVEHCGGTWVANSEVSTGTPETRKINLNVTELNKFAGLEIPVSEIHRILQQLGFGVNESNNHWEVSVPGWRNDVSIAVDLYEEVMRIYGYDHVPMDGKLNATLGTFEGMGLRKSENRMRQYLINQGMLEASTNSLHPSAWYPGMEDLVYLSNPLSTDMDVMRASLTPGLLQSVAYNINRKAESVQLFEVGRTYRKTVKGFKETPMLSMVFWGAVQPESWESKAKMVDHYHVKRRVMGILRSLGSEATADNITIAEAPKNWLTAAEINGTVWCVEFPWRKFIKQKAETLKVVSAPKYPGMRRDLSLVVAKEQTFAELEGVVKSIKLPLLQDVRVFDVFEGKPLDAGQKAVALSFHFLSAESTLTDTEVDRCMDKLMKAFEAGGATIRK